MRDHPSLHGLKDLFDRGWKIIEADTNSWVEWALFRRDSDSRQFVLNRRCVRGGHAVVVDPTDDELELFRRDPYASRNCERALLYPYFRQVMGFLIEL